MTLEASAGVNLYVGLTLAATVGLLILYGRARAEVLLLCSFLALVATNFIAMGFAASDPHYVQLAFLGLAADPFYLLLFVAKYPYPAVGRSVRLLLVLVGLIGLVNLGLVVWYPRSIFPNFPSLVGTGWGLVSFSVGLAIAYTGAWVVAVLRSSEARTPMLSARGAMVALAVGIAVLPRLGLIPLDLHLDLFERLFAGGESTLPRHFAKVVFEAVLGLSIGVAFMLVGAWAARQRKRPLTPELRRTLWLVFAALVFFAVARITSETALSQGAQGAGALGYSLIYGLRWLVFAIIVAYGLLVHQAIEIEGSRVRLFANLAGLVVGLGVFVTVLANVTLFAVDERTRSLLAATLGFTAAVPSATVARLVARRYQGRRRMDSDRRLELYRAALELAWAQGRPGHRQRRRLESDRRAWGVSPEEADALEYVVSRSLSDSTRSVESGFEIAPGIVVDREIGRGSQGHSFLAHDAKMGKNVVVKQFTGDSWREGRAQRALLNELRSLKGLRHPNVPRMIQAGITGNLPFIVTEFIDGENLQKRLRRGALDICECTAMLRQLLGALEAVHKRGTIHGDIKPENIIRSPGGQYYLVDFGASSLPAPPGFRQTVARAAELVDVTGTLAYMAPEIAEGQPWSVRADLYSLGLVAYEAATGTPAHDLRGISLPRAFELVTHPQIDFQNVPNGLRSILEKALRKDPGQRFESAVGMNDAVGSLRPRRRVLAARI